MDFKRKRLSILVGSLFLLGMVPGAEDLTDRILLAKSHAYIVFPPEVVAGPDVHRMWWSHNGKQLAFSRSSPVTDNQSVVGVLEGAQLVRQPGSNTLSVYDMVSKKVVSVFPLPRPYATIEEIHWLPGSSAYVIELASEVEEQSNSLLLRTTAGTTVVLTGGASESTLLVSPTKPVGAVLQKDGGQVLIRAFGPAGWLAPAVPVSGSPENYSWTNSGLISAQLVPTNEPRARLEVHQVDPVTGGSRRISGESLMPDRETILDVELEAVNLQGRSASGQLTSRALLLKANGINGDEPGSRVVLSKDVDMFEVPATADAVCYRSQGMLVVRRLSKLPRSALESAYYAALRKKAVERAKQAGLAVLMYSADYDEVFPDPSDLVNKVLPYIKSRDILEGFIYTFSGGTFTEDPATSEIGFYPGPGGRAVVYGDGHVVWIGSK